MKYAVPVAAAAAGLIASSGVGLWETIGGGVHLAQSYDHCMQNASSAVSTSITASPNRSERPVKFGSSNETVHEQPFSAKDFLKKQQQPLEYFGTPISGFNQMKSIGKGSVCNENSQFEAGAKGFGIGVVHSLEDAAIFAVAAKIARMIEGPTTQQSSSAHRLLSNSIAVAGSGITLYELISAAVQMANSHKECPTETQGQAVAWDGKPFIGFQNMISDAKSTICNENSRLDAGLKGVGIGTIHGIEDSLILGVGSVLLAGGSAAVMAMSE